jgi:tricorn protease
MVSARRTIAIGESKYAWNPTWSPDGRWIAFVDDRARSASSTSKRGASRRPTRRRHQCARRHGARLVAGLAWLAYSKSFPNRMRRIVVWNANTRQARPLTTRSPMRARPRSTATAGTSTSSPAPTSPSRRAGRTRAACRRSRRTRRTSGAALDDPTPFPLRSDEEPAGATPPRPDTASAPVRIDFEASRARIIALPMPVRSYGLSSPARAAACSSARGAQHAGLVLHKFTLSDRKAEAFARGVTRVSASADGRKLLYQSGGNWQVVDATRPRADANTGG